MVNHEYQTLYLTGITLQSEQLTKLGRTHLLVNLTKTCVGCAQEEPLIKFYSTTLDKIGDTCLDCLFLSAQTAEAYITALVLD